MSTEHSHSNYPKLHNAMWPGLVGKGSPGAEPSIDLDTMLNLTAQAEVDGVKFDGVDLFLFDPHISIDVSDDGIRALADKIRGKGLMIGSVVAPVWPPTGGGSAMGSAEDHGERLAAEGEICWGGMHSWRNMVDLLERVGGMPDNVQQEDTVSRFGNRRSAKDSPMRLT